jgi:AraC-like DNA-binding protein
VAQIGYELGFASPSHFVAAYKAEFGLTPEQYRQRYAEWQLTGPKETSPLDLSTIDLNRPIDWAAIELH